MMLSQERVQQLMYHSIRSLADPVELQRSSVIVFRPRLLLTSDRVFPKHINTCIGFMNSTFVHAMAILSVNGNSCPADLKESRPNCRQGERQREARPPQTGGKT